MSRGRRNGRHALTRQRAGPSPAAASGEAAADVDADSRAFRLLLERGPQERLDDATPGMPVRLDPHRAGGTPEPSMRAERIEALEQTVLRSEVPARSFLVRITDGTTTVTRRVERSLYIGRAPAPPPGRGRASAHDCIAIGRRDPSLAATHLHLSVAGSQLYARDLGSGAGAVVAPEDGSSFRLAPGARVALTTGARVRIGDRVTVVVQEAAVTDQAAAGPAPVGRSR